jgi:glycosyltransferase involved in cell wall biosynthesis
VQRSWLIVSKPLRAPFRDGTTVLARDLVAGLDPAYHLTYFGDPAAPLRENGAVIEAPAMHYAPGLLDKARVLRALVSPGRRTLPLHLFFTPNKVTSTVVALLSAGSRRVVQTLTSSEGAERHVDLLRRVERVVVHSDHGRERLIAAGLEPGRVRRIHPGVALAEPAPDPAAARRLLYAGDLDAQVAVRLGVVAGALQQGWSLTVATRPKGEDHGRLRAQLASLGPAVEVLGEVADMDALFRRCSLQLFLADHLRNKVDRPLALLEGCARGLGLLVSGGAAPLGELFAEGARLGLEPGRRVAVDELADAVQAATADPGALARWGADARALIERSFSTARMLGEYAELYASL